MFYEMLLVGALLVWTERGRSEQNGQGRAKSPEDKSQATRWNPRQGAMYLPGSQDRWGPLPLPLLDGGCSAVGLHLSHHAVWKLKQPEERLHGEDPTASSAFPALWVCHLGSGSSGWSPPAPANTVDQRQTDPSKPCPNYRFLIRMIIC